MAARPIDRRGAVTVAPPVDSEHYDCAHRFWPELDLSVRAVDEAVWAQQERLSSFAQVISADREVYPAASRTRHDGYAWVYERLRDRYTVVLNHSERLFPAVFDLCQWLGSHYGAVVESSIFLTPPGSECFGMHYDIVDVLMVQVAGSKTWNVTAPSIPNPTHRQRWRSTTSRPYDQSRPTITNLELGPGQALYVPRGFHHAGTTGSELSLHVSFTVNTASTEQLLLAALSHRVDADPVLRRNRSELDDLRVDISVDAVARADFDRKYRLSSICGPVRGGGLFEHVGRPLDATTELTKYLGRTAGYEYSGTDYILIYLPTLGGYALDGAFKVPPPAPVLRWPAFLDVVIDHINGAESFTAEDLPTLTSAEALKVVTQLCGRGFLVPTTC